MFNRIREFKRISKDIHSEKTLETDQDDRRIIRLSVADDSCFLSPFSAEGIPVISQDTADFLDHNLKQMLPDSRIHFIISSDQIDDEEQIIYRKAITNYYHSEFSETAREMKKNMMQSIMMTIIAVMVFAVSVFLNTLDTKVIILDMLDVIAWVFMWEAVDLFFFQRSVLKIRQLRNLSIIKAKIMFKHK